MSTIEHSNRGAETTASVARAYERRVNPNFWDLVRSGKRKQEFNDAFGRLAVGVRKELSLNQLHETDPVKRREAAVTMAIEQKHQIEQTVAHDFANERPKRGKIANWFAEKSTLAKGAIVGSFSVLFRDTIGGIAAGVMQNRLGRTNTDANPELVNSAQSDADVVLVDKIAYSDGSLTATTQTLHESINQQAEAIRKPMIDDAKAMAIGWGVGSLVGYLVLDPIGEEWAEAARYAEAVEKAEAAQAA